MSSMSIHEVIGMADGQPVRFQAMIDKIFPPKQIRKNGSSFSVQEVVLTDGRDTVSLSTFDQVPMASVGKRALVTGNRSDWRDRDRVLHKTLKGRIELLVNGNGKPRQEQPGSAPSPAQTDSFTIQARDDYERRDLWILFQSSLKTAGEVVSGVAPLCKSPEDLPKAAETAKQIVIRMAGEFLRTVSSIKADTSLLEIRRFVEDSRIPADVVKMLLADTGASCLCELAERQRRSILADLRDMVRKQKPEGDN